MLHKKCPTCNRKYTDPQMYCSKCGIRLVKDDNRCSEPKTRACECTVCADDDIYCTYCGALTAFAVETGCKNIK